MKAFLLNIGFCLIALITFSQKPLVYLEVSPSEAEVGEIITVSVKSNVQGDIEVELPSGFVHGYNVVNAMDQEIDYATGKVITYYYFSQTGAMPKAGTFKFGPAYVKKGNKVYKSNTASVTINKENSSPISDEITAKQLRQPAFGIIEKNKSVIYEGEPVILNAKVYARFDASHLENYQPYTMDGVLDKHDIGNTTRIMVEEEKIKRTTYYTFVYDKKVMFPTGTGVMTIDPYKLTLRRGFDGIPITSASTTIEVKPLPGNIPKNFIGGVGQFSISREIKGNSFTQGDVFTMIVEVSGHGNLQNILEPNLNLPKGFIVYGDPIVKEDFTFGSRGAEGKITYEYNIQITHYGKLNFPETEISYFDPQKEKYIASSTGSATFEVRKNPNFKAAPSDSASVENLAQETELAPFRRNDGNKLSENVLYNSKSFWIGVTSPLVLALVLGFALRKKEESKIAGEQKLVKQKSQIAIQHLFAEAEMALKNNDWDNYYNFIEKGILRSMALFLKQDDSYVMNKTEIFHLLSERKIDSSKIEALKNVLVTCENARYGLGSSEDEREKAVFKAKDLIQSIVRS